MIITPSERRKAEEFQALLEGQSIAADADLPLMDLSQRLRSMETGPEIDPLFRDRLRMRLLAVATVQGIGEDAAHPTRSERLRPVQQPRSAPRRLALMAGTVGTLVALTGVGAASDGAVPGDTLYNVKRSREAAQLTLARSDVSRGQLHLDFARTRLAEAISLRNNPAALGAALTDMDTETRRGITALGGAASDRRAQAPLDVVDDFVATQRRGLISLISSQPKSRRARTVDSLTLLDKVRERSGGLRSSLQCDSLLGARVADELGVVPRRCAALPASPSQQQPAPPAGQSQPSGQEAKPGAPPPPAVGRPAPSGPPQAAPSPAPDQPVTPQQPEPAPSPSGGTDEMLDSVTGTVGGVVGGVLDPFDSLPLDDFGP